MHSPQQHIYTMTRQLNTAPSISQHSYIYILVMLFHIHPCFSNSRFFVQSVSQHNRNLRTGSSLFKHDESAKSHDAAGYFATEPVPPNNNFWDNHPSNPSRAAQQSPHLAETEGKSLSQTHPTRRQQSRTETSGSREVSVTRSPTRVVIFQHQTGLY